MIVLDAAAVPDFASGARTRLRGLLGAYGQVAAAPSLVVRIARGATLLAGVDLRAVQVEETPRPGGPWRRMAMPRLRSVPDGPLVRAAKLWHSETIPPLQPRGVPALLTIHDLRWSEPRAVTGAPWCAWAARHAAARLWLPSLARALAGVVTVSEASAQQIRARLGVPPQRVHVVANANVFAPAPRLAAAAEAALLARLQVANAPFLLAIGALEPRKGLDCVLAALARAPADGALARARLVLVGSGGGEAALRALAARLGLGGRIAFAGALDDASVASLYARAAALAFPSRCEGFGFPVREALAHGCPVVARRLPVLEECAGAGVTLLDDDANDGEAIARWGTALDACVARTESAGTARSPRSPAVPWSWDHSARALASLYSRAIR